MNYLKKCVRACMRTYVRACVRACVCVNKDNNLLIYPEVFNTSLSFTGIGLFNIRLGSYLPKFDITVLLRISNSYGTFPLLKFDILGILA